MTIDKESEQIAPFTKIEANPTNITTQSPNINFSPTINVGGPKVIANSRSVKTLPLRAEPVHNVKLLSAKAFHISYAAYEDGFIEGGDKGIPAVKACFRNKSLGSGIAIESLEWAKAHISFYDSSGEIEEVTKAVWLGQGEKDSIEIAVNGTECLVIALLSEEGWRAPYLRKEVHQGTWEPPITRYSIQPKSLPFGELTAEISITGSFGPTDVHLDPFLVKFKLNQDGTCFVHPPETASQQ